MFRREPTPDDNFSDLAEAYLGGRLSREEAATFEAALAGDERLRKALVAALSRQVLLEVGLGEAPPEASTEPCRRARALRTAYESQKIESAELSRLARHLEVCTECMAFFSPLRPRSASEFSGPRPRPWRRRMLIGAGVCAALIGTGLLWKTGGSGGLDTSDKVAARASNRGAKFDLEGYPITSFSVVDILESSGSPVPSQLNLEQLGEWVESTLTEKANLGRSWVEELSHCEEAESLVIVLRGMADRAAAEKVALLGGFFFSDRVATSMRSNALRAFLKILGPAGQAWVTDEVLSQRTAQVFDLYIRSLEQAVTPRRSAETLLLDEGSLVRLFDESYEWATNENLSFVLKLLVRGRSPEAYSRAFRWGNEREFSRASGSQLAISPVSALIQSAEYLPPDAPPDVEKVVDSWRKVGNERFKAEAACEWLDFQPSDLGRHRDLLALAAKLGRNERAMCLIKALRHPRRELVPEYESYLELVTREHPDDGFAGAKARLQVLLDAWKAKPPASPPPSLPSSTPTSPPPVPPPSRPTSTPTSPPPGPPIHAP